MIYSAFDLIHVYIVYKYIYIHYQCMKRCGENNKTFHPNPIGRSWSTWSTAPQQQEPTSSSNVHRTILGEDMVSGKVIACWNVEDPPDLNSGEKKSWSQKKTMSFHKPPQSCDVWWCLKKKLNKPRQRHSPQTFWIQWQGYGFFVSFFAKVSPFQLDDHLRFIMLNGESPPKGKSRFGNRSPILTIIIISWGSREKQKKNRTLPTSEGEPWYEAFGA